jgi:16S rRNA (cytidine1402-2'-O)-methyltransferase
VLARELTKKFEELLRGTPGKLLELAQKRSLKGEFVVLVGRICEERTGRVADKTSSDPGTFPE